MPDPICGRCKFWDRGCGVVCAACREKKRIAFRAKIEAGICTASGCGLPPRPGMKMCAPCAAASVERNRKARALRRGRHVVSQVPIIAALDDYDAVL